MTGRWIWENTRNEKDEYVDFQAKFTADGNAPVTVRISSDTDFTLYINGKLAGFGQYPDYPQYKIYETFDVTPFVKEGENVFAVEAYHGGETSTHYLYKSGIRFCVTCGGETVLQSDAKVQSRLSRIYKSHVERYVTPQLGYSYSYDANACDGWKTGESADGFHDSVEIFGMAKELLSRPVKRPETGELVQGVPLATDGTYFLFDLGREEAGYPELTVFAAARTKLRLSWGEHILDGKVRSCIDGRDFSVEIDVPAGETKFVSYFLRLGARYLQIEASEDVGVTFCGLRTAFYPLQNEKQHVLSSPLRQKIYDTCVRTLKLCMHNHYEDCPWREQAMYALDSRNQMLCGYFAFGEYEFARASLELMCNDPGADGYMTICFPTNFALKIPSFSLHWFTQMREYVTYSGDTSLAEKYYDKLVGLLARFLLRTEDGLLPNFYGDKTFWNFYEWSDGLSGKIFTEEKKRFDLPLNCLTVIAMQNTDDILAYLGKERQYGERIAQMRKKINETFYCADKGMYRDFSDGKHFSELGNALAVLCGAADENRAAAIAARIAAKDGAFTPASLSTAAFVYDALLRVNKKKYAAFILGDIDEKYGYMLDNGATSFWETLVGADDFGGAGSLCHGWSAMPVYYYHVLGQIRI